MEARRTGINPQNAPGCHCWRVRWLVCKEPLSCTTTVIRPVLNSAATQKKGWRWKRTRQRQPKCPNAKLKQAKLADLDWLLWAHAAGEICLKFLDESGFCLWSPVSYTYSPVGQQKVLQQTTRRGRRLNILGLYSVGVSFE
ncbi:hypothetical protein [Chroococcidiopsis sp. CCMEE 29]|uniref:hypothetical protein n=1 Tax=Chroococcidiopsis sp. CCMEE 29 TaxID=155894 RepID=UPI002020B04D|nr:hypothetical protein [Chroococcidiopsis sp. CCMEE 29]